MTSHSMLRTRWAAVGAAVAITLGAVGLGGLNIASADVSSGDRPVFIPINPCRLLDTRAAAPVGPKTSPVGPGETYTVAAHGSNGECTSASAIPTDAVSLSLNVTAVGATASTFLTFWGEGANPGTSNLNPRPGAAPTPNSVTTPLSADGTFNIYNDAGNVNIIADVNGYYVGHDHDDRYYTEAEADTRFAPAGAAVTPVNIYSFIFDQPSDWEIGFVPQHSSTVATECAFAPLHTPPNSIITGVDLSYVALAGAEVDVSVVRTRNRVGAFTGTGDIVKVPVGASSTMLPATPANTVGSFSFAATSTDVPEIGDSVALVVCTGADLAILGVTIDTPPT